MPEGDTIFRSAQALRRALAGRQLLRFEAPRLVGAGPQPGQTVRDVETRGKHLLVHFEATDGAPAVSVRTHLRMRGSWHLYRPGEAWRKPAHAASIVIEVPGAVAVCFSAFDIEVLGARQLREHRVLGRLGPDLCRPDADLDEALRRMEQLVEPATEIGAVLLDQRVTSGVGNVYKSEALHACEVHPFLPVGLVDVETRRKLLETAGRQLRANLGGYPRRTVAEGLAVYGRAGRPCRRCATLVRSARGHDGRLTYWCPACQPAPREGD